MARRVSLDQQIQHVRGQLQAVAWEIRQAKADDDYAALAVCEIRRDELLDWMNRLVPQPREPEEAS